MQIHYVKLHICLQIIPITEIFCPISHEKTEDTEVIRLLYYL